MLTPCRLDNFVDSDCSVLLSIQSASMFNLKRTLNLQSFYSVIRGQIHGGDRFFILFFVELAYTHIPSGCRA